MLTHRNVRFSAAALVSVLRPEDLADEAGIRTISYLPMAHVAGRLTDHWLPMTHPEAVAFCPDPTQLFDIAPQIRPTVLTGVPRVWEKLQTALLSVIAARPDEAARTLLARVGLDACRLAITGAAPIGPEVIEFFLALGLPMTEVWGMTELSGAATISHPSQALTGTVGTACPGIELNIADDGEILVRAPLVMRGYYRDLSGTAEAVDSAGWLHTGDVGTLDGEGRLRIVDRKKELIITSGGKNISPAAIETLLQRHPLIGQACAVGDRRNYVTALLVLDSEAASTWAGRHCLASASRAELATHPRLLAEVEQGVRAANERLARVEQVRRFMLLPTEWTVATGELTPTLKRRRRVITDLYASEIERLYGPVEAGVVDL
jgi:long-chain acyl-CoA synthetase